MTQPTLRPYQDDGVAAIRRAFAGGRKRVLYVAPTGSGKTVLFSYVVAGARARGNAVVIIGHRQEIVDQIDRALTDFDVPHGVIAAGYPETAERVQVASVATLVRRLDRVAAADLLVPDEAHHAVAGMWSAIIAAAPKAKILGVTATPQRLDGKGLADVFDVMVPGPTTAELIAAGYLAPFVAYAPPRDPDLSGIKKRAGDFAVEQLRDLMSEGVVIGAAVDEYERLCAGAPAIAFTVDIQHSKQVTDRFVQRGFRAAHLDGTTPADVRRARIAALGTGELQVLCNCGLISEGVDVPIVSAAILLRPTSSLALFLQQCGRVLRPAPGKERALIIDHAGNTARFGLPDMARAWSLEGHAERAEAEPRNGKRLRVLHCRACSAQNRIQAEACAACAAPLRVQRIEKIPAGPLVEASGLKAMPYRCIMRWAGRDEQRLREIAKARGYKSGWVYYRLKAIEKEKRT